MVPMEDLQDRGRGNIDLVVALQIEAHAHGISTRNLGTLDTSGGARGRGAYPQPMPLQFDSARPSSLEMRTGFFDCTAQTRICADTKKQRILAALTGASAGAAGTARGDISSTPESRVPWIGPAGVAWVSRVGGKAPTTTARLSAGWGDTRSAILYSPPFIVEPKPGTVTSFPNFFHVGSGSRR